jgi:K+-sensing histidine kinase KdpD
VTPAEPTRPSTDPLSRALSGVIPPMALLALLVVAMYPFRDDLGSGTVALILLLPPLVATVGGLWVALAMAAVCAGALNFFFIHPYYSFRIESGESVAAFFIYLLVAAIVAIFASRDPSGRAHSRRARPPSRRSCIGRLSIS